MIMLKKCLLLLLVMSGWLGLYGKTVLAAETINVYTYHIHPPFINESGVGQTFELVSLLQAAGQDRFNFKVRKIPRSRLNMVLNKWVNGECLSKRVDDCQDNWILLWVNQKWGFGAEQQKNFHWVKITEDSNSIISLKSNKVDYKDPQSLTGLKLGGISGHKYVGIDSLVELGKINRINGSDERENILKLYKKRFDTTLLPTSTIQYYMAKDSLISTFADKIYIADKKHQKYSRNIMIPKTRDDLYTLIRSVDMSDFQ